MQPHHHPCEVFHLLVVTLTSPHRYYAGLHIHLNWQDLIVHKEAVHKMIAKVVDWHKLINYQDGKVVPIASRCLYYNSILWFNDWIFRLCSRSRIKVPRILSTEIFNLHLLASINYIPSVVKFNYSTGMYTCNWNFWSLHKWRYKFN